MKQGLTQYNENVVNIKQNKSKIQIHVYSILLKHRNIKIETFVDQLLSLKVTFSLILSKEGFHLLIYDTNDEQNSEISKKLEKIESWNGLEKAQNIKELFIPPIKKIKSSGEINKIISDGKEERYFLAYQLKSIESENKKSQKAFSRLVRAVLKGGIFTLVITQSPIGMQKRKGQAEWGLMLFTEDKREEILQRKNQSFIQVLKTNSTKINVELILISKKDIEWNKASFRFLIPWIRQKGIFSDLLDISRVLEDIEPSSTIERRVEDLMEKQKSETSQIIKQGTKTTKQNPFPTVRKPSESAYRQYETSFQAATTLIEPKDQKKEEDSTHNLSKIPQPQRNLNNKNMDKERVKYVLCKVFGELGFKESWIFEHKFDLVLRKKPSYILVKIAEDTFKVSDAYTMVEDLSSITGLRNDITCILVSNILEKGVSKVLNEQNVIHLTIADILAEKQLKSKIYESLGGPYSCAQLT